MRRLTEGAAPAIAAGSGARRRRLPEQPELGCRR